MMQNMTNFDFGDVVLVSFPFTNQIGIKQRPAIVINSVNYSQSKNDLILMAISSQNRLANEFATIEIVNWKAAGLLKESVVKPVIFTIEKQLIKKVLGKLDKIDKQSLRQALTLILG